MAVHANCHDLRSLHCCAIIPEMNTFDAYIPPAQRTQFLVFVAIIANIFLTGLALLEMLTRKITITTNVNVFADVAHVEPPPYVPNAALYTTQPARLHGHPSIQQDQNFSNVWNEKKN